MKDKPERALKSLSRILSVPVDSEEVEEEFAEISANLTHEREVGPRAIWTASAPERVAMPSVFGLGWGFRPFDS